MAVRLDRHRQRRAWMIVFDLPLGPDGKRRQYLRRGFTSETAARTAERRPRPGSPPSI